MKTSAFTPQDTRIFNLLNDGEFHDNKEIIQQCMDSLSSVGTMRVAINSLRNKLPNGLAIEYTTRQPGFRRGYRMLRKLVNDE